MLSEMDDCTLYNKYLELTQTEPDNTQVWTMCATAALQLCNAPNDASRQILFETYVTVLKGMSPDKCPCSDVIPEGFWE